MALHLDNKLWAAPLPHYGAHKTVINSLPQANTRNTMTAPIFLPWYRRALPYGLRKIP